MKVCQTEAIVLSTRDYGESDRLVTFFTRTGGMVCGIAKGARRSTKRFSNSFEPCNLVDLAYRDRKSLAFIEACRLIEPHLEIRCEGERWGYAALVCEIVRGGVAEGEPQPETFELLSGALGQLSKDKDPLNVVILFALRFQALMGYMPALDGCTVCACKPEDSVRWWWRIGQGALVCSGHPAPGKGWIRLDLGTLTLIHQARRLPVDRIWRLRVLRESKGPLFWGMLDWVRSCTGNDLNSLRLLEQLETGPGKRNAGFAGATITAGGCSLPERI